MTAAGDAAGQRRQGVGRDPRGVFAGRDIQPAGDLVQLTAPFRPLDQRAVPVEVEAHFADGRSVRGITLIVDENPSPVAAQFDFGGTREHVHVATKLRLNAGTDVRGHHRSLRRAALHGRAVRALCRRAGGVLGATVRQPGGDRGDDGQDEPRGAVEAGCCDADRAARTAQIMHPNHTGMVLDQLTLLYVPLRIITELEVMQGEERVFAMKGSMTMAQDPVIDFDYRSKRATALHIEARDSGGASWARDFPIGQGS
ncbi:MAG: thiosulfate oxidation carrier protein SoxY [Hyphomicrobium sp.]